MANERLCVNCMKPFALPDGEPNGAGTVCPHCGWDHSHTQPKNALSVYTVLQNRYIIGRVISADGQGFTYMALDREQEETVEISEFFPTGDAGQALTLRDEDDLRVVPIQDTDKLFNRYLHAFLADARRLAYLRGVPGLTSVLHIFEENGTGYCVREWKESITLRYFVEHSGGHLDWNAAKNLLMPVLSALSTMSAAGVQHFHISPDTILVDKDGKARLSGFRLADCHHSGTPLKCTLSSGCAALEQYTKDVAGSESTDVYGFTACLFFALTGGLPKSAPARRKDPRLLLPNAYGKSIPPHVVTAMANALQLFPENRTASFERLRAELTAAPTVTASIETRQMQAQMPPAYQDVPEDKGAPPFLWMLGSCIITLSVLLVLIFFWSKSNGGKVPAASSSAVSSVISSQPVSSAPTSSTESTESTTVMVTVPDFYRENYKEWAEKTKDGALGFVVRLSDYGFSDEAKEGEIMDQSPKEGEQVTMGATITVVVSKGPRTRTLPTVTGMTLADACAALSKEGFNPAKEDVYSDIVPYGNIVGYKSYAAGDSCDYGSRVVLLLSKGKNPTASKN